MLGEEGARAAQPLGKVRGNADGLTKRQLLPALTPFRARELRRHATEAEKLLWRALREAFPTAKFRRQVPLGRSEEHTSELQSLMRISYAVFCLKKKK